MVLNIGGCDYKLEYTFEAVLNEECVETVITLFDGMASDNDEAIKVMSTMPKKVITLFYAGLIENHDVSIADAKVLLKTYFKENPDADNGNFYGMCQAIFGQMADDGFFKSIGLEAVVDAVENQTEQKKVPQDHKKKATSTSKK